MITDAQARFEWETTLLDTRVSTNTYDLGVANRDIGRVGGDDLFLVGIVTTSFVRAAGAMTVACDLVDDDNAALSSPATLQGLMAATSKATLVAGYVMFKARLALDKITQRYLGLQWTCSAAGDSGKVSVFFTADVDSQFAFPRGYVAY